MSYQYKPTLPRTPVGKTFGLPDQKSYPNKESLNFTIFFFEVESLFQYPLLLVHVVCTNRRIRSPEVDLLGCQLTHCPVAK